MRAIFISYRREDAEGQAGRLFDDLEQHFGAQSVFMDVAGIEVGRDFRKAIDEHVASCGVLLAMMGKHWLDAKQPDGRRRLEDPLDFVRIETVSALKRDIPVVPVLVQGARMPMAGELPPELAELAFRNAIELTHARWDSDVAVLIKALERHVAPDKPVEPARLAKQSTPLGAPRARSQRAWMVVGTAALTATTLVAALKLASPGDEPLPGTVVEESRTPLNPAPSDPIKTGPSPSTPTPSEKQENAPVTKPTPSSTTAASDPVTLAEDPEPRGPDSTRLASRLMGRWTWGKQPCAEGPNITLPKGRLVVTTPTSRFVHRILSDDGATLKTEVLVPPAHAGNLYEFRLTGGALLLYEPKTSEKNVWSRCRG